MRLGPQSRGSHGSQRFDSRLQFHIAVVYDRHALCARDNNGLSEYCLPKDIICDNRLGIQPVALEYARILVKDSGMSRDLTSNEPDV